VETTPTTPTGGSAASQADWLDERQWKPHPVSAWIVRVILVLVPLLCAAGAVHVAATLVGAPEPTFWFVVWLAALVAVAIAASAAAQRLVRRFAPLVSILRMSLIFPDHAPSRFHTAIRVGTTRSLKRSVDAGVDDSSPEQRAAEDLVDLMARLNTHDRLTHGHAERVRAYSVMLGEQIGLTGDDLDRLNWAALAHDVGKLEVDPEILNKKGRPTLEEWDALRVHPGAAEPFIAPLRAWLGPWADAATQHHERWDGTGYPEGLAGADISLAGRIVARRCRRRAGVSGPTRRRSRPAARW
jgi:hypothetical protein